MTLVVLHLRFWSNTSLFMLTFKLPLIFNKILCNNRSSTCSFPGSWSWPVLLPPEERFQGLLRHRSQRSQEEARVKGQGRRSGLSGGKHGNGHRGPGNSQAVGPESDKRKSWGKRNADLRPVGRARVKNTMLVSERIKRMKDEKMAKKKKRKQQLTS